MNQRPENRRLIGIRVAKWTYYLHDIYQGIVDYAESVGGWRLNTNAESDSEMEPITINSSWNGDGLILFRYDSREARAFRKRGIPVVSLSREGAADDIPYVGLDNARAGELAAEHLLSLGLRNFAAWSDPTRRYSRERVEAFIRRIEAAGHTVARMEAPISEIPTSPEKWQEIHQLIRKHVERLERPVGIFVKDDLTTPAVTSVCRELGLSVPEQVAVIGCGGDPVLACISDPPMSSIACDVRRVGFEAARLLDTMMRSGKSNPADVLLSPQRIVRRKSTETFVAESLVVRDAMQLIQVRAPKEALRVSQLCAELGVSRMTLLKGFRESLARSPKEEIQRVRLETAKELVLRIELSFKEIAFSMGFGSSDELSRFFKLQAGCSPTEYRRLHAGRAEGLKNALAEI